MANADPVMKSQTSHLILRRLRSLGVFAELLPCTTKLADLTWKPKGIVFSGGMGYLNAWFAPMSDSYIRPFFCLRRGRAP